ncbi:MAG: thioesterase family protein, partial [Chloroflexi bacterium]|nr:thioesterase family protein [Chloroflexota bacterium]
SEWIDYNGHMSEAYYVLVFGYATDALLDRIGMDAAYRARTGTSVYTVEAHLTYLRGAKAGEPLRVTTQLLDLDGKRLRMFHTMLHADSGAVLATEELLLVHVDTRGPRSAPFAPEIMGRLEEIQAAHATLPPPDPAGRSIAIPRP